MATETSQAAPQPAPQAQPSGETPKTGAANSTVSSFAQALVRKEAAQQAQIEAVEKANPAPPEEKAKPATEETQVPTTEVSPTETETADPAETAPEEKTDEVLSHENKLDPETQEKINRRIGKERLKTKAAEGQIAHLQAQIAQMQKQFGAAPEEKQVVVPVPANTPLADVNDVNALAEVQRQARANQRAAEELLDRDDIANGVKVGDRIYSKSDLKAIIRESRVTLEDLVPQRQQFLTAKEQARQKTLEQFPYLQDRTSTEYMEHQSALRANPWLMAQPNADWIVAVQLEGMRALEAKTTAASKPDKKPVNKQKPAGDQTAVGADGSASRVSVASVTAAAKAAANNVLNGKRGVGAKDFAEYLRQNEQLKLSR